MNPKAAAHLIPAFPVPLNPGEGYNPETHGPADGMTLRDWFASQELSKVDGVLICDTPECYDRLADHCYRMADAMLRAREAKC
jgi:hypothetical protein